MLKKAWLYYRVATDQFNNALFTQRQMLLYFANEKRIHVVGESGDVGSGLSFEREGLSKMLAAIESGLIDTMIVKDISRFGRDIVPTYQLMKERIEAFGVKILSVY